MTGRRSCPTLGNPRRSGRKCIEYLGGRRIYTNIREFIDGGCPDSSPLQLRDVVGDLPYQKDSVGIPPQGGLLD